MSERLIGAVEAGGTKFIVALATQSGQILDRTRIDTGDSGKTLGAVRSFYENASAAHGAIAGFGIATFGPIDIDPRSPGYGIYTTTPKPTWSGASWIDCLAGFAAPVVVDTDVNGAALGEWMAGAGRGCETLAYTTVGTGIGSGVLHRGAIRGGISHYESGHVLAPHDRTRDPFPGCCTVHGDCYEGLASGTAIMKRYGASLDRLGPAETDLVAGYLAHLAATIALLHMPDRQVFGGGVLKAAGLIEAIRQKTEAILNGYIGHPRMDPGLNQYLVTPGLGDDAGITGAIELGRRAVALA